MKISRKNVETWITLFAFIITVLVAILTLVPKVHPSSHSITLSFPLNADNVKQYDGARFEWFILTDLGKFAIYRTTTWRLNDEWFKRQKDRTFCVCSFADMKRKEIWYSDPDCLQAEIYNVIDVESFKKAIKKDFSVDAWKWHEEMRRWLGGEDRLRRRR